MKKKQRINQQEDDKVDFCSCQHRAVHDTLKLMKFPVFLVITLLTKKMMRQTTIDNLIELIKKEPPKKTRC